MYLTDSGNFRICVCACLCDLVYFRLSIYILSFLRIKRK